MSGTRSRNKGARGERELFGLLNDHLGAGFVKRQLSQTREGGSDGDTDAPFSIEVKRCEKLQLTKWWNQTQTQAAQEGQQPVLAYRQNGQDWQILVGMTVHEFAEYARETANSSPVTCGECGTEWIAADCPKCGE